MLVRIRAILRGKTGAGVLDKLGTAQTELERF